jgi:2-polyprenyl-3-methyl-5-hydroxy-6-metoxy-1,4-benzoquinol methylase
MMSDTTRRSESDETFVCPWWLIYSFDNPLRRLLQRPERILGGLVAPGDCCLDVGCGMGYFTIPIARMVGPSGRVTAVDLQRRMLEGAARRARKRGVDARITLSTPDQPGWRAPAQYDFVLAFWMVHEVPDQATFFGVLRSALKGGGRLLMVEPRVHVSARHFEESVERALAAGFLEAARPRVAISRSVVLR